MIRRRVVATSGGFSTGIGVGLDAATLALTGSPRPRTLFVPTAGGDNADYITRFYAAFSDRAEASHVSLFRRDRGDLEELCCSQDLIYVGGGNTANMLAVWRLHGFDRALRLAYEAGVILTGISAGAVCWFDAGVTDSFGMPLRGLAGLGWLRGAVAPHYDGDPARKPALHELVAASSRTGFGIEDGAAMYFVDEQLAGVWTARDAATVHRVDRVGDQIVEHPLEATVVPAV